MTQYMKPWMLVALTMAIMLLVAPAVSAEEQKYTVRPSTSETPPDSVRISDSIIEGQTNTHYSYVGSGVNYLEVDLDWGDPTDSLSLTIYPPVALILEPTTMEVVEVLIGRCLDHISAPPADILGTLV